MRNLLTPASVAATLGISTVALHNWRKRGVGPSWVKRGPFYYYRQDHLQEYLDRLGPIPEGMSPREKHRFFTNANKPEVTPEEIPETPETDRGPTRKELAARLAVVETKLANLTRARERKLSKRKARDVTEAMLAVRRVDREAARLAKCGAPKMEGA